MPQAAGTAAGDLAHTGVIVPTVIGWAVLPLGGVSAAHVLASNFRHPAFHVLESLVARMAPHSAHVGATLASVAATVDGTVSADAAADALSRLDKAFDRAELARAVRVLERPPSNRVGRAELIAVLTNGRAAHALPTAFGAPSALAAATAARGIGGEFSKLRTSPFALPADEFCQLRCGSFVLPLRQAADPTSFATATTGEVTQLASDAKMHVALTLQHEGAAPPPMVSARKEQPVMIDSMRKYEEDVPAVVHPPKAAQDAPKPVLVHQQPHMHAEPVPHRPARCGMCACADRGGRFGHRRLLVGRHVRGSQGWLSLLVLPG